MKYFSTMEELQHAVETCTRCALAKTRRNAVFGEGNPHARIMFVGEGPGEREDATGRPFVGPAGQLLDKMLHAIDLAREDVYIANIVKCRPPGNADPLPEYATTCLPFLREQVRAVQPRIIVCLGRIAMQYILKEQGIMRQHGKVFRRGNFIIIPTYHPSALLRNTALKRDAWEDFKTIRRLWEQCDG